MDARGDVEPHEKFMRMSRAAARLRRLCEASDGDAPTEKEPQMKYADDEHAGAGAVPDRGLAEAGCSGAHIAFMKDFARRLREAGELVAAEGLSGPDQARRVRAGSDGKPITDGVFPEAKEFLAGYWIVDVDRTERAYEIAAEASAAPGPGGKPLNLEIEVRQVMSGPPEDWV